MRLRILTLGLLTCSLVACNGQSRTPAHAPHQVSRILMLPGIINTRFHLEAMADMCRQAHPTAIVEIRAWGLPLLPMHNLAAYDRNRATAQKLADELACFRRANPAAVIDVVGYSGGGAMAVFVVEALPADVDINRLIVVAPALSFDYPLAERVLPHVREFAVNFASLHDHQVGLGTRLFGTMDRKKVDSGGFCGFSPPHPRLLQVLWHKGMMAEGHFGNHLSYLSSAWQRKYILPALDPTLDLAVLRAMIGPDQPWGEGYQDH